MGMVAITNVALPSIAAAIVFSTPDEPANDNPVGSTTVCPTLAAACSMLRSPGCAFSDSHGHLRVSRRARDCRNQHATHQRVAARLRPDGPRTVNRNTTIASPVPWLAVTRPTRWRCNARTFMSSTGQSCRMACSRPCIENPQATISRPAPTPVGFHRCR